MMVIAVGLSSYNIGLFHLVNHAFYKALLFLGAGAVIHGVADNQDFRKYGGLRPYMPLTNPNGPSVNYFRFLFTYIKLKETIKKIIISPFSLINELRPPVSYVQYI